MVDVCTIRLAHGLGSLCFGSSREEVRNYLGEPDHIEQLDPSSPLYPYLGASVIWRYCRQHHIEATLKPDANGELRLVELATTSTSANLVGQQLIGNATEEAIRALAHAGIRLRNVAPGSDGDDLLFFSQGLCLLSSQDIVHEITWSMLTDN